METYLTYVYAWNSSIISALFIDSRASICTSFFLPSESSSLQLFQKWSLREQQN